jgi:hypothetical protein
LSFNTPKFIRGIDALSDSMTEAEYIATYEVVEEAV